MTLHSQGTRALIFENFGPIYNRGACAAEWQREVLEHHADTSWPGHGSWHGSQLSTLTSSSFTSSSFSSSCFSSSSFSSSSFSSSSFGSRCRYATRVYRRYLLVYCRSLFAGLVYFLFWNGSQLSSFTSALPVPYSSLLAYCRFLSC